MITVNQAVESAVKFALDIASMKTNYPTSDSKMSQIVVFPLEKLRVEEVNYSETDNTWLITLGWNDKEFEKSIGSTTLITGASAESQRTYKVLHIDAETGDVKKMVRRNI